MNSGQFGDLGVGEISPFEDDIVVLPDGARIAARLVRRAGPVKGRILFVNGAITTASALKWAVRGLEDFELVLFDFPSVGRSRELNPGPCGMVLEAEGAIVAALADRYRPDMLISLSWGGASALAALALRPVSIRRAIISSYSFGMGPRMRAYCDEVIRLIDAGEDRAAASYAVDQLGERLQPRFREHFKTYFLELDREQIAYVKAHIRYVAGLVPNDYLAALHRIDVPVLFANGAGDRFTPPESVLGMRGHVRDASFLTIPRLGHFLANEDREARLAVCEAIRDWWSPEGATDLMAATS